MPVRIYLSPSETQVFFRDEGTGILKKGKPRMLTQSVSGDFITITDEQGRSVWPATLFSDILNSGGAQAGATLEDTINYLEILGFKVGGGGGIGDITDGANVGGAPGEPFFQKNGSILEFRTCQGVNGLDVVNNGQTVEVDGQQKENVIKRVIRLPGPGPDNLSFGTLGFVNYYYGTNGFVQTMVLPFGDITVDGLIIPIKSLGAIGPVINVQAQPGQTINNEVNNIFVPDNGHFKFQWSWNGGINPTWGTL